MPRRMRFVSIWLLSLLLVAGCDDTTPADGGTARDAGAAADAGRDAGAMDAGTSDAGSSDAGTDAGSSDAGSSDAGTDAGPGDAGTDAGPGDAGSDAGWDAAAGCHGVGFGADIVTIEGSGPGMPVPTGGVIPLGRYNLVRVQNHGGTGGGTMRSTWEFRGSGALATLTAAAPTPGSSLPVAAPRLNTWSTSSTSLMRTETCGGDASATVAYSVVVSGSITVLRLQSGPLVLTYRLQ